MQEQQSLAQVFCKWLSMPATRMIYLCPTQGSGFLLSKIWAIFVAMMYIIAPQEVIVKYVRI